MSGYLDPFSGLFGDWVIWAYFAWAGLIVTAMFLIFIGFDSGGFLHRLEERFGIRNVDQPKDDDQMI